MKIVEVTKQQRQEIVYLYNEKGYGIEKVKKEMGLSLGYEKVKQILKEEGVHLRNFTEAKVGRYEQEVSREVELRVIEAYSKGWGLDKIVDKLKLPFSFDKVRSILKKNGVHIRDNKEAYQVCEKVELRKYLLNDNYDLLSHNGAWLMGFIAADGYLPNTKGARNRIVITLAKKDEEILYRVAEDLEFTGNLHDYVYTLGTTHIETSLAFASKTIRNKLESYGIVNNKTYKLEHLPDIPDESMIDFIAGYFDGDGSVYKKHKGLACNFTCASKQFLIEINDFLVRYLNLHEDCGRIRSDHNVFQLRYYRQEDVFKILSAFYDNDYLRLQRKKDRYLAHKK